jgi:hypothetical protein
MKNIDAFCETKGVSQHMKEAFQAYLRSTYAQKFLLSNGESTKLIVGKMNDEELKQAWQGFVTDLKKLIS